MEPYDRFLSLIHQETLVASHDTAQQLEPTWEDNPVFLALHQVNDIGNDLLSMGYNPGMSIYKPPRNQLLEE